MGDQGDSKGAEHDAGVRQAYLPDERDDRLAWWLKESLAFKAARAEAARPDSEADRGAGEDEPLARVPSDPVNHPSHYTSSDAKCSKCRHPIECVDVAEHHDFLLGNVIKYAWRVGLKEGNSPVQDLKKAEWYLRRAIKREETKNGKA